MIWEDPPTDGHLGKGGEDRAETKEEQAHTSYMQTH